MAKAGSYTGRRFGDRFCRPSGAWIIGVPETQGLRPGLTTAAPPGLRMVQTMPHTLPPDRRTALKLAAALGLPAWLTDELRAADEPKPAAAEKPKIALIGCGGQGRGDAKNASRFGTVVAVCDVDANRAAEAAKQFNGAAVYADFRKLLDKEKGVSVVINGTPDHWHTLVNLAALKAGKDVYGEKPLTLTIDEGKRLVAAVKASGRVFQTGSQQRSDARFRLACEVVRNGRLGKLTEITTILPAG